MDVLPRGELPRHETDLDEGTHAVFQQAVIDLVHVGEVVDRVSLAVLVVYPHLVVKDGVKTHVAKVRGLFQLPQVRAITCAQRQYGAAGSEGLLPEVRKGTARGAGVDLNRASRGGSLAAHRTAAHEEQGQGRLADPH